MTHRDKQKSVLARQVGWGGGGALGEQPPLPLAAEFDRRARPSPLKCVSD